MQVNDIVITTDEFDNYQDDRGYTVSNMVGIIVSIKGDICTVSFDDEQVTLKIHRDYLRLFDG